VIPADLDLFRGTDLIVPQDPRLAIQAGLDSIRGTDQIVSQDLSLVLQVGLDLIRDIVLGVARDTAQDLSHGIVLDSFHGSPLIVFAPCSVRFDQVLPNL